MECAREPFTLAYKWNVLANRSHSYTNEMCSRTAHTRIQMKCAREPLTLAYKVLIDLLFLSHEEQARQSYCLYKMQKIMKKSWVVGFVTNSATKEKHLKLKLGAHERNAYTMGWDTITALRWGYLFKF
jgi:hypothetical protein